MFKTQNPSTQKKKKKGKPIWKGFIKPDVDTSNEKEVNIHRQVDMKKVWEIWIKSLSWKLLYYKRCLEFPTNLFYFDEWLLIKFFLSFFSLPLPFFPLPTLSVSVLFSFLTSRFKGRFGRSGQSCDMTNV